MRQLSAHLQTADRPIKLTDYALITNCSINLIDSIFSCSTHCGKKIKIAQFTANKQQQLRKALCKCTDEWHDPPLSALLLMQFSKLISFSSIFSPSLIALHVIALGNVQLVARCCSTTAAAAAADDDDDDEITNSRQHNSKLNFWNEGQSTCETFETLLLLLLTAVASVTLVSLVKQSYCHHHHHHCHWLGCRLSFLSLFAGMYNSCCCCCFQFKWTRVGSLPAIEWWSSLLWR